MALTIPTRHVDEADPAADVNLIVAEVNRVGGLVDGQSTWVVPASGASDDDLIDAALTGGRSRIVLPARAYVVNRTHVVGVDGLSIEFRPGATVQVGTAPTGTIATTGRVFQVHGRSRVSITGASFLAPATPLVGTPADESAIIHVEDSTDCRFADIVANYTNLFPPSTVDGEGYQRTASVVLVKGALSDRNTIERLRATGCEAALYSYYGACRTVVRDVSCYSSPRNGLSGYGNTSDIGKDCLLDDIVIVSPARIGIEDWTHMRGTQMRSVRVSSPGLMGISAVSVRPLIVGASISGSPSYAGIELSANGSVVVGGQVQVAATTASGIICDGNGYAGIAGGDPARGGTIIGTEVWGGQYGIRSANANTGVVLAEGCRVHDWVTRGLDLSNTGTDVYPSQARGCVLRQELASTGSGARIGIACNADGLVSGCSVQYTTAAVGPLVEIPIYLGAAGVTYDGNTVDFGSATFPGGSGVSSFGATPANVIIRDTRLRGGAPLNLQWLVNPTHVGTDASGGSVTRGSGGAATGPVRVGGSPGGVEIWECTGTPEAQVTAPVGSLALRRDGGASTSIYVKESGGAATGWVAK